MSMKSLSAPDGAEEASRGLSCLMDRVGGMERGEKVDLFERSRPAVHLSTTATG